jgi:hypothetical protein
VLLGVDWTMVDALAAWTIGVVAVAIALISLRISRRSMNDAEDQMKLAERQTVLAERLARPILSLAPTNLKVGDVFLGDMNDSFRFSVTVGNDGGVIARQVEVVSFMDGKEVSRTGLVAAALSPGASIHPTISIPGPLVKHYDRETAIAEFNGQLVLEAQARNAEPARWPER